jgi:hypothetical protein
MLSDGSRVDMVDTTVAFGLILFAYTMVHVTENHTTLTT